MILLEALQPRATAFDAIQESTPSLLVRCLRWFREYFLQTLETLRFGLLIEVGGGYAVVDKVEAEIADEMNKGAFIVAG